jgi:putative transposase
VGKNSLTHVVWDCKYHIVLVPKYRYKVFEKDVKESVRDELKKLCLWLRLPLIEGHIAKDHVHICVAIPPKLAVAEVVGTLKGKTAIRMFNKFPDLKKRYWGNHFWSRGYYVSTVGRNEEVVKEYIRNQDKLDRLGNQGKLYR